MTEPANPAVEATPQVGQEGSELSSRPLGPHPGAEPRANPSARWLTILLGALLLSVAAVLAREIWYRHQEGPFASWVDPVFTFLGSQPVTIAGVVIGILISLVGLWLIISSFLPRPRTHVQVNSSASIWVRPVDIARKATATARAETGGTAIRSKANRKSVTVQVEDDGTGTLNEQVIGAVNNEFRRLTHPPAVNVKITPQVGHTGQSAAAPAAPAAPAPAVEMKEVQR